MFFLDEKTVNAIPSLSLWKKGDRVLSENKFDSDDDEFAFIQEARKNTEQKIQAEIDSWQSYFEAAGEEMEGGFIKSSFILYGFENGENKSIQGIANEFSQINSQYKLTEFAIQYGNLGLTLEKKERDLFEQFSQYDPSYSLTSWNAFENVKPGFSYFEPFELWWHHILKVRNILKLYRALSRLNRGLTAEIEDSLLVIEDETNQGYKVNWFDGTPTLVSISEDDLTDIVQIGRLVLRKSIERYASKGISIGASDIIETKKSNLGFYVLEKKTTEYLITAIYYDLWQLINASLEVDICHNPNCQLPFMKVKRQQYCSDACKQEAYRLRKNKRGGK